MNILIKIALITNIIQIILFLSGTILLFYKHATPKTRADVATANAIVLLMYFACFSVLLIEGFLKGETIYLASIIFLIAPFIIGKLVRYQTLKKYSIIQFLVFSLSLVYLLKLYF